MPIAPPTTPNTPKQRLALRLKPRRKSPNDYPMPAIKYLDTTVHTREQVQQAIDMAIRQHMTVTFLLEPSGVFPKKSSEPWKNPDRPDYLYFTLDPSDYTATQPGNGGSIAVMTEDGARGDDD